MIPMLLSMDIQSGGRSRFRLFFPVILLWILAAVVLVAIFPLLLVAALATMNRGPGFTLLAVYPLFFGTVFALSGLRIDVSSRRDDTVFISFD
jgi:hypothetical protein